MTVFLMRRSRRKKQSPAPASTPQTLPPGVTHPSAPALPPPGQVETEIESQLAERDALQAKMDAQALSSLKLAPVITKKAEVFAKHLRDKIGKEPDVSVQILRSWIREEEN
jgi:flagellar biosynthesis/type III secretory pathway M-ring protein FliF/YscJ